MGGTPLVVSFFLSHFETLAGVAVIYQDVVPAKEVP